MWDLIGVLNGRLAPRSGGGSCAILEPRGFFVQEPQVNCPKEEIQESKDLQNENGELEIDFVFFLLIWTYDRYV